MCFYYILKNNAWIFIGVSRRLVVVWVQEGTVCGGIHSTDCLSIYKRHQLLESWDRTCSLYDPWASKTTCGNLNKGQMIFTINDILKHLPKQFINVMTLRQKSDITISPLRPYIVSNHDDDMISVIYCLGLIYETLAIFILEQAANLAILFAAMSADVDRRR